MLKWFSKKSSARQTIARDNTQWVEALRKPQDEKAIADLRNILIRGIKPALHKYVDRELNQFAEDVAQDALMKIIDKVNTFRSESKFTTWALKIAVREGLSELKRKKWNDVSLNQFTGAGGKSAGDSAELPFPSQAPGPDRETHESIVLQNVLSISASLLNVSLPENHPKKLCRWFKTT